MRARHMGGEDRRESHMNVSTTNLRAGRERGAGLVVRSPGGPLGWLARRIFPVSATRAYLAFIRVTRAGATRRFIDGFMSAPETPLFDHVEIETINRCNGECAFCPVSRKHDPRPLRIMPESLFHVILGQLRNLRFTGYFALFSNNEPLLDARLEDFAAAARHALPGAAINLSSNGSLLGLDRFRALLPHFDRIVLNNYRDRPVMREEIRRIHDFCASGEGRELLANKTVEINLRAEGDVLTSRAGSAPNRPPPKRPPAVPCSLPFSQMVVRPDGKVSLCCNDALGRMTLGDLSAEAMIEVWRGDRFRRVRELMYRKGREALPLCRDCDFVKHDVGRRHAAG